MLLPDQIRLEVERALESPLEGVVPVGGGCIANASRVRARGEDFFLKWVVGRSSGALIAEADGLAALSSARSSLRVPEVIALEAFEGEAAVLILEWIPRSPPTEPFWDRFGAGLAELHRSTARHYGHDRDNFIGQLPQKNTPHKSWPEFFAECRLHPQVAMAREAGRWHTKWDRAIDQLLSRMSELLPESPPASLLHGDLWHGNFLADPRGSAVLIDPAVYNGHRETDLAMSELFGGFPKRFYDRYADAWPLEPGYKVRREVYNLYHLLNHLNHFGSGYEGRVDQVLGRYG